MKLESEAQRLRAADENILRGQHLVEQQLTAVYELERNGENATVAKRPLDSLELSLEAMVEHRSRIEQTIPNLRMRRSR